MKIQLGLTFAWAVVFLGARAADWGYSGSHGPSHWADDNPDCGKDSQSPIDIDTDEAEHKSYDKFTFTGYTTATAIKSLSLTNNGHSAKLVVEAQTQLTVEKGGLPSTYKVAQLHFHWGSDDNSGSEHKINGKQYPLEMHIVHYDSGNYDTINEAMTEKDGLAVLGVLFEVGDSTNENFNAIINNLRNIQREGNSRNINAFPLSTLLPSISDMSRFFRYSGSLTTPPCYESVVWTVFNQTNSLSSSQLAEFRKLFYEDGSAMQNNFRPIQDLNGRTVYASFPSGASAIIAQYIMIAFLAIAVQLYLRQ